jgi:hypothetical protein
MPMPSMKIPILTIACLASFSLFADAQAPVGPGSVKLDKIKPEGVNTPEYTITGGSNKRFKTGKWIEIEVGFDTKPEEIDELTFAFSALIGKELLTGEVTYVNISKGKDHWAVMYISPKALDKLLGGKPVTGAEIENIWVEVNKNGQVLDKTSLKPGNIPNVAKHPGFLLNKMQTPFAPLYYDRYEDIKAPR